MSFKYWDYKHRPQKDNISIKDKLENTCSTKRLKRITWRI